MEADGGRHQILGSSPSPQRVWGLFPEKQATLTTKNRVLALQAGSLSSDFHEMRYHDSAPAQAQRNLRISTFFGDRPPPFIFAFGVVFCLVVSLLDYVSWSGISIGLFYLMPIVLITWHLSRRAGVVIAISATIAGVASDVLSDPSSDLVSYWNGLVRLGVFIALATLISALKGSIELQRDVAMHEHDVTEQLRDLNELKNTLLHAVSHGLQGPIAAIVEAVSALRRWELQLTDEQSEGLLEVIDRSGRRMDRLLNDLLDLDRIDRGLLHPDRQPTDAGALADQATAACEVLVTNPVRVDADKFLVDVDPIMVKRVLDNLLVNAAWHTPLGTPVHMFIHRCANGVEIVVEDEGPGISDELKLVLFDSFRKGPGRTGDGVGIGLSLVKRFAELHGGTARVEDRHGGGARFVISLPGQVTELNASAAKKPGRRIALVSREGVFTEDLE